MLRQKMATSRAVRVPAGEGEHGPPGRLVGGGGAAGAVARPPVHARVPGEELGHPCGDRRGAPGSRRRSRGPGSDGSCRRGRARGARRPRPRRAGPPPPPASPFAGKPPWSLRQTRYPGHGPTDAGGSVAAVEDSPALVPVPGADYDALVADATRCSTRSTPPSAAWPNTPTAPVRCAGGRSATHASRPTRSRAPASATSTSGADRRLPPRPGTKQLPWPTSPTTGGSSSARSSGSSASSARLSLRRLSELAGISNPYLSQIERGLRRPVGRDPPADRQGPAHLGRDPLRPGRHPRAPDGDTDLSRHIFADQPPHRGAAPGPHADLPLVPRTRTRTWRRRGDRPGAGDGTGRRPGDRRATPADRRRPPADAPPPGRIGAGMRRLAVLSLHTSPLAQPGTGDGGGMNVYVRELSSALARAGVVCDVYTRAWSDDLPPVLDIEPGLPGPPRRGRAARPAGQGGALLGVVDEFADGVLKSMTHGRDPRRRRRPALRRRPRQLLAQRHRRPHASSTSSTCRWSRPSTPWTG